MAGQGRESGCCAVRLGRKKRSTWKSLGGEGGGGGAPGGRNREVEEGRRKASATIKFVQAVGNSGNQKEFGEKVGKGVGERRVPNDTGSLHRELSNDGDRQGEKA